MIFAELHPRHSCMGADLSSAARMAGARYLLNDLIETAMVKPVMNNKVN